MPNIIGPFQPVTSNMPQIDAYISHLRHLSNLGAARRILQERFGMPNAKAKNVAVQLSAHVEEALEFYAQSITSPRRIRPVLQYYCYLNLAVAVILAYQPKNFKQQYRQHGVKDKSHDLKTLGLRSVLVQAKRGGAVPLFHSIISGESIKGQLFRLIELASGIPMLSHELRSVFKKRLKGSSLMKELKKTTISGVPKLG